MSSMSPNFILKAHLHNRQKSPECSLAGFLPILTFLVGVCICGALDCYILFGNIIYYDGSVRVDCSIVLKRDAIHAVRH